MKKLMIAAAIVCAAAMSQAANVTWSSGAFVDLPSCYGYQMDYGTGCGEASGCIMAYVWESTTAFDYKTAEDVYNAYKSGALDIANAKSQESDMYMGTANVAGADTFSDGQDVYAAILYLHKDVDGAVTPETPDFYMANLASAKASNVGADLGELGNTWGGATGSGATVWTATAVPEPTSGLLLLLGVAGLALKRRRA